MRHFRGGKATGCDKLSCNGLFSRSGIYAPKSMVRRRVDHVVPMGTGEGLFVKGLRKHEVAVHDAVASAIHLAVRLG